MYRDIHTDTDTVADADAATATATATERETETVKDTDLGLELGLGLALALHPHLDLDPDHDLDLDRAHDHARVHRQHHEERRVLGEENERLKDFDDLVGWAAVEVVDEQHQAHTAAQFRTERWKMLPQKPQQLRVDEIVVDVGQRFFAVKLTAKHLDIGLDRVHIARGVDSGR